MKIASAVLATVVLCRIASAATPGIQGFWRLGEGDAGVVIGGAAGNATADSSGNSNVLGLSGSPAPTFSSLAAPKNSTVSMLFGGTSNYAGPAMNTGTDNWGIEIWAYPTSAGNRVVIYNGNTSNAGYGIYQHTSNWALLYGGIILQDAAPVALNQWTDLALVRSNGSATLYVNGVAHALTTATPNAVAGNMVIAANQLGTERFVGYLDEGRLFTVSGGFDPANLQVNGPGGPATSAAGAPALSGFGLLLLATLLVAVATGAMVRMRRQE
ncbi:MAG: LamG domain-containing protein [Acidobacteria bacterium]|nr:LamG domain-containing protein [Acidobacteriota bacterium]